MVRKSMIAVRTGLVVVLAAGLAQAAMITFEFGGVVTSVQDPTGALGGGVEVNDEFSGTFTFDSTTPDSRPEDGTLGYYLFPDGVMTLQVGSVTVSSDLGTHHSISVRDNRDGFTDGFTMGSSVYQSGNIWVSELYVYLNDPTMTAFNSDALPLDPPDLARFATKSFSFQGQGGFDVRGDVTILTPEPAVWALVLLGGLSLLGRR